MCAFEFFCFYGSHWQIPLKKSSRQPFQNLDYMRAEHCDAVVVLRSLHVCLSSVLELIPPSPDQSEISFLLAMLNSHLWMDINDTIWLLYMHALPGIHQSAKTFTLETECLTSGQVAELHHPPARLSHIASQFKFPFLSHPQGMVNIA